MSDLNESLMKCEQLARVETWGQFSSGFPNIWRTPNEARHFLNTRRAQMTRAGALFKTTKGLMVDPECLIKILPGLLQHPDQEQLNLQLGEDGLGVAA